MSKKNRDFVKNESFYGHARANLVLVPKVTKTRCFSKNPIVRSKKVFRRNTTNILAILHKICCNLVMKNFRIQNFTILFQLLNWQVYVENRMCRMNGSLSILKYGRKMIIPDIVIEIFFCSKLYVRPEAPEQMFWDLRVWLSTACCF